MLKELLSLFEFDKGCIVIIPFCKVVRVFGQSNVHNVGNVRYDNV